MEVSRESKDIVRPKKRIGVGYHYGEKYSLWLISTGILIAFNEADYIVTWEELVRSVNVQRILAKGGLNGETEK